MVTFYKQPTSQQKNKVLRIVREEKSCDGRRCPELPDNWQLISVSSQAEHFLINSVPVSSVSAAPGYPSRVPASPHQQPNLQNNITTELSLQIDIISSR